MANASGDTEGITLGGGCFWCVEAVYARVEGVEEAISGYAGGHVPDPTYRAVCSGATGHAEVVQVRFRPDTIPLRQILEIFFTVHDPTTHNRQGADIGTQYRSAIFYHDEDQGAVVREVVADLDANGPWDDPIVTEIAPLDTFYPAEDYHQEYYDQNRQQPYCRAVIDPKVAKFRQRFAHRLRD